MKNAATTETYSYDSVGNRLSSLAASPWSYNASNQLTQIAGSPATTFTYDNNGNGLTKTDTSGTTSYVWDYENRLSSVTLPGSGGVVSFKYDPFGRRIQKASASSTTVYAYDGDNIVEEANLSGTAQARFAMGPSIDEPLAQLRSGTTHFYSADGLGSITGLTSTAGAVAASYSYDAFGNLVASTGSLVNPFLYTAREWDSETGLYFYRARYYDQKLGRFLSEDPIGFEAGIGFYIYVDNGPIDLRDPWGLQARPKPAVSPTPVDPTPQPPGPVLVPNRTPPSVVERIISGLGRAASLTVGVAVMILTSPMDLNEHEQVRTDPNPDPSRKIKKPDCPSRGCTCTCRADADDTMPGNIRPGRPLFAFGTATASSCEEASKAAKRIATRILGMKPKHIPCVCTSRGG